MPPSGQRRTRVRSHTRRDGTRVRSHRRRVSWAPAAAAWSGAGVASATSLALLVELGFVLVSTLALVLTAALGTIAVRASKRASANRRKMRSYARSGGKKHTRKRRRQR